VHEAIRTYDFSMIHRNLERLARMLEERR